MKAAALAAAAGVAGAAWAVRGRTSAVFGPSVWRGSDRRRAVALTFDDGPTKATPEILQALYSFNVRATFFECGMNTERHPDIAREVARAGHQIGNHSHSHPNCALKSPGFIRDEFRRAQNAIQTATGVTPRLMRAPYGVRWFGFGRMQQELGLQGVMWSIIGRDWRLPAAAIAARIISRVKPGDIICLHDGRGTLENPDISQTVEAVRRIIPALMETGYHFETVTDLLCPRK
ncbi:MAG TPA: polysaccharide deacetylase family protein [Candidatus Binataceae bacterium]